MAGVAVSLLPCVLSCSWRMCSEPLATWDNWWGEGVSAVSVALPFDEWAMSRLLCHRHLMLRYYVAIIVFWSKWGPQVHLGVRGNGC